MRKLLLFIILSLVLVSCNHNRDDEYVCKYKDRTSLIMTIKNENILKENKYMKEKQDFKIRKENSEKIEAEWDVKPVSIWYMTFYKKTLKLKIYRLDLKNGKRSFMQILTCEKLN